MTLKTLSGTYLKIDGYPSQYTSHSALSQALAEDTV